MGRSGFPVGETAAVFTSLMWTMGSIFFATAVRRIGWFAVNSIRILLASLILVVIHFAAFKTVLPDAIPAEWFYMSLSSIVGLVVGDFAYFAALYFLGPRRSVLLLATAPIFSVITGYLWLGEKLDIWGFAGILITMTGVLVVILEKEGKTGEKPLTVREKAIGVSCGALASVAQGVGLVISKVGMVRAGSADGKMLNPLSASLIRMIVASLLIWLVTAFMGRSRRLFSCLNDKTTRRGILGGTLCGPTFGIWLSMIAVKNANAGIASTLMSLMPVMIVPILFVLYRQKTSLRSITGALVTVCGVAILFLL